VYMCSVSRKVQMCIIVIKDTNGDIVFMNVTRIQIICTLCIFQIYIVCINNV